MFQAELAGHFLLLALFSWVMARDMKRRPGGGFFHPVMRGFIPVALVSLVAFIGMQGSDSAEIAKYREAFIATYSQAMEAIYKDKGLGTAAAREMAQTFFRLQPGLQCLFWLVVLSGVAFVMRRMLARRGQTSMPAPLSRWKAPDLLIWLLLLPGALVLMDDRGWLGEVEAWIRDLSLNFLVVTVAVYVFQGMMVLLERLTRAGLPKFFGNLLMALALLVSTLPSGRGPAWALLLLGVFDTWFDLRNLNPKAKDDERSSS